MVKSIEGAGYGKLAVDRLCRGVRAWTWNLPHHYQHEKAATHGAEHEKAHILCRAPSRWTHTGVDVVTSPLLMLPP